MLFESPHASVSESMVSFQGRSVPIRQITGIRRDSKVRDQGGFLALIGIGLILFSLIAYVGADDESRVPAALFWGLPGLGLAIAATRVKRSVTHRVWLRTAGEETAGFVTEQAEQADAFAAAVAAAIAGLK